MNKYKIQKSPSEITDVRKKRVDKFYMLKNLFLEKLVENNTSEDALADFSRALGTADLSYSLCGQFVDLNSIPRTACMISGPSFVSQGFPQPKNESNEFLYPVLQLNMEWIGRMTNKKYKAELLQLWWDSDSMDGRILQIPLSEISEQEATPIEISEKTRAAAEHWVPFEWLPQDEQFGFLIMDCTPIGITYQDIEELVDELISTGVSPEIEKLANDLCFDEKFHINVSSSKHQAIKIYGSFRSHIGSSWLSTEVSLLHTSQWASGSQHANIYMHSDQLGIVADYSFEYGR